MVFREDGTGRLDILNWGYGKVYTFHWKTEGAQLFLKWSKVFSSDDENIDEFYLAEAEEEPYEQHIGLWSIGEEMTPIGQQVAVLSLSAHPSKSLDKVARWGRHQNQDYTGSKLIDERG